MIVDEPKTWPGALARVAELAADSWGRTLRLSVLALVVIVPLLAMWWSFRGFR